jgi:hypothetical protein
MIPTTKLQVPCHRPRPGDAPAVRVVCSVAGISYTRRATNAPLPRLAPRGMDVAICFLRQQQAFPKELHMSQQQRQDQQQQKKQQQQSKFEDGKGGKDPQEEQDESVSDESQESFDQEETDKGSRRNS